MGNSPSTPSQATRKSTAHIRSSSQGTRKDSNLEDEFNNLILHQVKQQQKLIPVGSRNRSQSITYDQFTNDLIEDEYNELNDGLIETDATELSEDIITKKDEKEEQAEVGGGVEDMEIDRNTPTPDLTKVDFTKIVAPQPNLYSNTDEELYHEEHQIDYVSKVGSNKTIPVEIKWVNTTKEEIHKISIIGSFSNWRSVVRLKPSNLHSNEYLTTIKLPLGVHKLLYIINSEYRVSEQLPTATDQEGIFFNWFEVLDSNHLFNHSANQPNHINASSDYDANIIQIAGKSNVDYIHQKSNDLLAKVTKETPDFEHIEHPIDDEYISYNDNYSNSFLDSIPQNLPCYSSDIPEMFVNYDYFKLKGPDYELPEPPQLPAHLNNVLLNKLSNNQSQSQVQLPSQKSDKRPALRRADSSYYNSNKEAYHLSIPNHVILNHLMTTSIRNEVLTVACITRYSGKFVTQIMHSPAE